MNSKEKLDELYSILNALQHKLSEVRARGDIEKMQTLSDTISKLELYIEARQKDICNEVNL